MSFDKRRNRAPLQGARRFRATSEITSEFILQYLSSLDCPRSLTVAILFREGEHQQLANLEFDPSHYLNNSDLGDAYAATKFLSKFEGLTLDQDPDEVAFEKFKNFESQCRLTNQRFRDLAMHPLFKGDIVWLHNAVIRKVSKILGRFSAAELFDNSDWGPGATTNLSSRHASHASKFQFETGITRDLYALVSSGTGAFTMKNEYPSWFAHLEESGFPGFLVGNKVVTVPKDATQSRVIAIEPGINLWFQKAIGEMIGCRLRRWGIDLRWQHVNQQLALKASNDATLATVDFSSASDSISSTLIRELLPSDWFEPMDAARSHYGSIEGVTTKWEKFSSMGNGFTFQLESLIFFAMVLCCKEYMNSSGDVSVYGDDVIVPVDCLDLFSRLSEFYGFTVNRKKSHSLTFFRESCGAHFVRGLDVKPVYFRSRLSTIQSVYRAANAVRRLAHRRGFKLYCEKRFRAVYYLLVSSVPSYLRLRIPENLGDGGFISNFDEASPDRAKHWIEGFFVKHYTDASVASEVDYIGLLFSRLWVSSVQSLRNTVTVRGRTRLRVSRSLVSQWHDLGPWL